MKREKKYLIWGIILFLIGAPGAIIFSLAIERGNSYPFLAILAIILSVPLSIAYSIIFFKRWQNIFSRISVALIWVCFLSGIITMALVFAWSDKYEIFGGLTTFSLFGSFATAMVALVRSYIYEKGERKSARTILQ